MSCSVRSRRAAIATGHLQASSNIRPSRLFTADGAIIAMHNGEPATTSALPTIISALRAKGYRFVTVSEMAAGLTH